jgi:hypothetical protein
LCAAVEENCEGGTQPTVAGLPKASFVPGGVSLLLIAGALSGWGVVLAAFSAGGLVAALLLPPPLLPQATSPRGTSVPTIRTTIRLPFIHISFRRLTKAMLGDGGATAHRAFPYASGAD